MKSKFAKLVLSVCMLLGIMFFVPINSIVSNILKFDLWSVLAAFILIFGSIVLSTVRLGVLLEGMGLHEPFKIIHHINVMSKIAGYFLFSTFGQMATRNIVGAVYLEKASRFAVITLMEKIIAISVLFLMALCGAWIISDSIGLVSSSAGYLGIILLSLIIASLCVYIFGLTASDRRYIKKILHLFALAGLGKAAGVTLIMHGMMLIAYAILAHSIAPDISLYFLASILTLVMLGASIPISFAGWGIRELSAGVAFTVFNIDPATGVSVALCVGGLSLLALVFHGAIIHFYPISDAEFNGTGKAKHITEPRKTEIHIERTVAYLCGLMVPILIAVQVRLPTETSYLSVNLADPLAIVGALTFLTLWVVHFRCQKLWRIKNFNLAIGCFVAMIGYGLVVAYIGYGGNHWAEFNRGSGVLILLAYLYCGAMVTALFSVFFVKKMVWNLLISILVIFIVYQSSVLNITESALSSLAWTTHHFNGLIGNRNALALILVIMICISIGFSYTKTNSWGGGNIALGLLIFLLFATGSRTGFICAVMAVLLGLMFKRKTVRDIGVAMVIAFTASTLAYGMKSLVFYVNGKSGFVSIGNPEKLLSSGEARRMSYIYGLEMWSGHPITGAGLGAFIEKHKDYGKKPLTIHNSVLWILAEMGIAGLALFLVLPITLILHLIRQCKDPPLSPQDYAILAILICVGMFAQPHEILYQRIIWLVLGMLAANKLCFAPKSKETCERASGISSLPDPLEEKVSYRENQIST